MKGESDRIVLVAFGLGGSTAFLAPRAGYGTCYIQGYESPETWDRHVHSYEVVNTQRRIVEGAILLDKRALLSAQPRLAYDSPLVDPSLQPGEESCFPTEAARSMLLGLEGTFQFLAARKTIEPEWKGLDSVSVQDYVKWWFERGAKVGIYQDSRSHWLHQTAGSAAGKPRVADSDKQT